MFGLFAGCLGAFWLQFCHNLASKSTAALKSSLPDLDEPAVDEARVDQILARCAAADDEHAHSPEVVARWIEFVNQHDLPIVIIRRNQAIVPSLTPAPRRVH